MDLQHVQCPSIMLELRLDHLGSVCKVYIKRLTTALRESQNTLI